jgi:hypothetical protein
LRKNGEEFTMEVRGSSFGKNPDIFTLVILRDISEKLKFEKRIKTIKRYR